MSGGVRRVASALVATTVGVLPVFLFGGMAPLIRADLGFEPRLIGAGVAVFFAASALTSVHGGRLGERLGSRGALLVGIAISAVSLAGTAILATHVAILAVLLALGGVANAIIQPAANLALARGVTQRRRGLAFGLKQSAVPAAASIGGFAVPALGVTFGWRTAFGGAALLTLLAAALPVADAVRPPRSAGTKAWMTHIPRSLWLLTAGIGLGSAAANSVSAYLVEAATDSGWRPGPAGTILGVAGVLAIVARITVGWYSDRMDDGRIRLVAAMAGIGAIGYAMLALMDVPVFLVAGVVLAFVAGWGYNGLFISAVVLLHPDTPASATGVTQAGAFGGAVIGPPIFGAVAAVTSYSAAWLLLAAVGVGTAALFTTARRRVLSERAVATST